MPLDLRDLLEGLEVRPTGGAIGHLDPRSRGFDAAARAAVAESWARALPGLRIRELLRLRPELLRDPERIILAVDPQGELAGILSHRWGRTAEGEPFLHVPVQMIGEAHQRSSLLKHMWRRLFELLSDGGERFPSVIAMRTCNPSAYQAMRVFTRIPDVGLFPGLAAANEDPLGRLAARIARVLEPDAHYSPRTGVLRGVGLPRDLYPDLPTCPRPDVDRFFRRRVRPEDRVLCVLSIASDRARSRILASFTTRLLVPRSSR